MATLITMRRLFRSLPTLALGALAPAAVAQATLNVHSGTGAPDVYLLSTMDSVVLDATAAPPRLRLYRTGLADLSYVAEQVDSLTYSAGGPIGSPLLATRTPAAVTGDCAIIGSFLANDNGSTVVANGVCWSTDPLPTVSDNTASSGFESGLCNTVLTGLSANTTYYARAFATNANGTAYGNQVSFTTSALPGGSWLLPGATYGSVTDIDGNTYATITIGGVEWMAENLRTTTYANGAPVPEQQNPDNWTTLSTGAWCNYNNDPVFDVPYGKLYNWYAVSDPRNVCPTGWHVPTDAEWTTLTDAFGGLPLAGQALKSTVLWSAPYGTNASAFAAVPGGDRIQSNGTFDAFAYSAFYWSATAFGANSSWGRELTSQSSSITRTDYNKKAGFSVRCVHD